MSKTFVHCSTCIHQEPRTLALPFLCCPSAGPSCPLSPPCGSFPRYSCIGSSWGGGRCWCPIEPGRKFGKYDCFRHTLLICQLHRLHVLHWPGLCTHKLKMRQFNPLKHAEERRGRGIRIRGTFLREWKFY